MATDWGKILNMKFSKIILSIIAFLLLIIVLVGAFSNKHIKIWGLEFNEKQKTDTVTITTHADIPKVIDSPVIQQKQKAIPINITIPPYTKNETHPKPEIKDTVVLVKGKNVNTGTNNGIIGDNATVNAPIQPHPDASHVIEMNKLVPNKKTKIRLYYNSNSRQSEVFTRELINLLKADGYIDIGFLMALDNALKADFKGIHRMIKGEGDVNFFVTVED